MATFSQSLRSEAGRPRFPTRPNLQLPFHQIDTLESFLSKVAVERNSWKENFV